MKNCRLYLILISLFIVSSTKAQLLDGSYSRIIENPITENTFAGDIEYDCRINITTKIFNRYSCISLSIFEGKLYIQKCSSFDTGNTNASTYGYYEVSLNPITSNSYEGKNEFIELTLETKENNEVEILIQKCIIHFDINTPGRGFSSGNHWVTENKRYYFKRDEFQNTDLSSVKQLIFYPASILLDDIKKQGIDYGSYRVKDTVVEFRDRASWSNDVIREVSGVDISSFKVLEVSLKNLHQIKIFSTQLYPFSDYAVDANKAYYQGLPIEGVNPIEVEVLDQLYMKTKQAVYFKDALIVNADVDSFQSLTQGYAKDKNNFYKEGKITKKDKNIEKLLKSKEE